MKSTDDCFEKGLLKKNEPNKILAMQDLSQAEFFLDEANDLLGIKKKEMAVIALYNAVFHAGRALLFKDGIKEKSHLCLQKYLEEEYEKTSRLKPEDVALFDVLRGIRQEVQYGVTKIKVCEDLADLSERTEQFIQKVEKIIG